MNKLDTALVAAALKDAGYGLTDDVRDADVVLINTCSVREHAEERVFSHLGHLKHAREHRPDLVVGVIGCMAQRLGETLLEHEAVDVVCGPTQIPQIAELVGEALERHEKRIAVAATVRRQDEAAGAALERFESAYSVDGIAEGALPGQAFVRVRSLRSRPRGVPTAAGHP